MIVKTVYQQAGSTTYIKLVDKMSWHSCCISLLTACSWPVIIKLEQAKQTRSDIAWRVEGNKPDATCVFLVE